jgi:hypothetical protein
MRRCGENLGHRSGAARYPMDSCTGAIWQTQRTRQAGAERRRAGGPPLPCEIRTYLTYRGLGRARLPTMLRGGAGVGRDLASRASQCRPPNSQVKSGQHPWPDVRSYIAKPTSAAPLLATFSRTGHLLSFPGQGVGVQTYLSCGLNRVNGLVRSGFYEQAAAPLPGKAPALPGAASPLRGDVHPL